MGTLWDNFRFFSFPFFAGRAEVFVVTGLRPKSVFCNQMFPSQSAIKCWWRRDLRSWIVGVLLCVAVSIFMVQLPTSPPSVGTSFSGHRPKVPGYISKKRNQQRRSDTHFKKQIVEESGKSALLAFRISFSTVFMIFPSPSVFLCSEQIPQDQNLLLAHHALHKLHKDTKLEQCYLCTRFDHCKEVFLDLL